MKFLPKFDPSKHKRGAKGRFTFKPKETPAPPAGTRKPIDIKQSTGVVSVKGRKQLLNRGTAKGNKPSTLATPKLTPEQRQRLATATGTSNPKALRALRNQGKVSGKPQLLKRLTPDQQSRLVEVLANKQPPPPPASTSEPAKKPRKRKEPTTTPQGASTSTGDNVATRKPRVPKVRKAPDKTSVTVTDKGIEVWKGKEIGKYDPTFKAKVDRKFEYEVRVDGKPIILNRNRNVYELDGEVVKGVPSSVPRLREMKTQSLFDQLATSMGHVEQAKTLDPPAPEWKPTLHGSVPPEYKYLVKSKQGLGKYGEMQIHHINQWARVKFEDIQKRFNYAEQIDPAEAKKAMEGLVTKAVKVDKKGNVKETWVIDVQSKKDRELVILASGVHDINSPLYKANHPMAYDPDTGKLRKFGIPPEGTDLDGNRDEFNAFRKKLWREHYKREAYILRGEINRRAAKGEIKPQDVQQYWDTAHEKARQREQYMVDLRKQAGKD